MKPRTTCPDCDEELVAVKLIDATERAMGDGAQHVEVAYAASAARASHLTQTVPKLGFVKGRMCVECGRILLYGDRATGGLLRD